MEIGKNFGRDGILVLKFQGDTEKKLYTILQGTIKLNFQKFTNFTRRLSTTVVKNPKPLMDATLN